MVENPGPKVGMRLRSIREQHELSLRALAERSGLSVNAISQIERGENSPTVSTLHRLATALNVPITDFFQEESRQMTVFVKRSSGMRSQSNGILMESLGIGLYNQHLEPFRLVIEPGISNLEDPVSHSGEEFVHCLEGEIEYCVGDRLFSLEQGDSLLFDAHQMHAYCNHTEREVTLLVVFETAQDRQRVRELHIQV